MTIVGFENNHDIQKNKNKILINLYSYIYMNINLEHYSIVIIIFAFIYLKYESSCNKRTIEKMSKTNNISDTINSEINKIFTNNKMKIQSIRKLAIISNTLQDNKDFVIPGNLRIEGNTTFEGKFNYLKPGIILTFNSNVAPKGWAICDGTNNTPDLRGKFIVGYNPSDPDYNNINKKGGENKHILTINEIPKHSHKIKDDGNHKHGVGIKLDGNVNDYDSSCGSSRCRYTSGGATYTSTNGNHTHSINNEGKNEPHENRPPYYVLTYIIKL